MMGTYDVVILDEPTAAMDMETTAAAETLIQSYVRQIQLYFDFGHPLPAAGKANR